MNGSYAVGYLSIFPPGPKQCTFKQALPTDGDRVFNFGDLTFDQFEQMFFDFLSALVQHNFGLKDFMFLMKAISPEMTSQSFYDWYSSLYYKSSSLENDICVSILGSTNDLDFTKKVYIKDITAPQEAIDSFIFLEDQGKIYTILGTKRKSPTIKITFSDGRTLDVLDTGLFGSVICGEHLEGSEKAQMNSNFSQYLKNRDETGSEYLKLSEKQVSAAIRGLLEELNFTPDQNFTPFLVGKDVMPGRDERYWKFGQDARYGYKRPSGSTMIAFVGHCKTPELEEPLDQYECSKGIVVELEYALREFCIDGKLACAFPAHARMLRDVTKILPEFFE